MGKKIILQIFIGLGLGIAIVAGINYITKPYIYQGSLIDPPSPAVDFSLEAGNESTFQLKEQRGNIVLLFFGYTHCPDVCPTTLYDFKQMKTSLGELSEKVKFVFVTVDPKRDTINHLNDYVTAFDTEFIALGGNYSELETVWSAYGVYREEKDVGSAGGYLVDHTARVYVIDLQGNLRLTFPFGMAPEAMTNDVMQLLEDAEL
jgi:protein SCO1/2